MWRLRCRNILVFIDGVLEFQTQDPSKKFTYELFCLSYCLYVSLKLKRNILTETI